MEKLAQNDGVLGDMGEGHVLDKHILSQPDVYSNWGMIESRIRQLQGTEKQIFEGIKNVNFFHNEGATLSLQWLIDEAFPMNTNSCFFPTPCDYLAICPNGNDYYKEHIAVDPLNEEFSRFERRVSHHDPEKITFLEIEKMEKEIKNAEKES